MKPRYIIIIVVVFVLLWYYKDESQAKSSQTLAGAKKYIDPDYRKQIEQASDIVTCYVNNKPVEVTFTPRFAPYFVNHKGKLETWLPYITDERTGVYFIIKESTNEIVYVGHAYTSQNIYKTMYRHFQQWNDKTQYRFTLPKQGYLVELALCRSDAVFALEKYYIARYKPIGNVMQYESVGRNLDFDLMNVVVAPDLNSVSNKTHVVYNVNVPGPKDEEWEEVPEWLRTLPDEEVPF